MSPYTVLRALAALWTKPTRSRISRLSWAAQIVLDHAPERLIADRAYDSDPLDERLRTERGIEIAGDPFVERWVRREESAQSPGRT